MAAVMDVSERRYRLIFERVQSLSCGISYESFHGLSSMDVQDKITPYGDITADLDIYDHCHAEILAFFQFLPGACEAAAADAWGITSPFSSSDPHTTPSSSISDLFPSDLDWGALIRALIAMIDESAPLFDEAELGLVVFDIDNFDELSKVGFETDINIDQAGNDLSNVASMPNCQNTSYSDERLAESVYQSRTPSATMFGAGSVYDSSSRTNGESSFSSPLHFSGHAVSDVRDFPATRPEEE